MVHRRNMNGFGREETPHSDNVINGEQSLYWGRRKWVAARAEVIVDEEAPTILKAAFGL